MAIATSLCRPFTTEGMGRDMAVEVEPTVEIARGRLAPGRLMLQITTRAATVARLSSARAVLAEAADPLPASAEQLLQAASAAQAHPVEAAANRRLLHVRFPNRRSSAPIS